MLGLKKGTIELIPYTVEWNRLFEIERLHIERAIHSYIESVHHVGSTSIDIPEMVAKPILDIAIHVESLENVQICVTKLEALGYEYRGEYGIPGRHYFVKGEPRTHHIHMMLPSCENRENQVLFRDYLSTHPEKAKEYAELKKRLLKECEGDRELYTESKGEFIAEVLRLARED